MQASRRLFRLTSTLRHDGASVRRRLSSRSTGVTAGGALVYNDHSYPYVWLRDSCRCPSCVHPTTLQRFRRSSDTPLDVKPAEHGVQATPDGLSVTWISGHQSHYPHDFLARYSSPQSVRAFHRDVDRVEWDVARLKQERDLFVPYDTLKTPSGLLTAITQLMRYGLLFVRSVPTEKTSDEECEVRVLGELFGEVRRTFYGETWDVKNMKNSHNIAYTDLFLGVHTDLAYFQHPPRYQILHCLRNRVNGGMSTFVDAVHVASMLRTSHPSSFDTLTSIPVPFQYVNDGHHLHKTHPTVQLSRFPSSVTGVHDIEFINYAPVNQAPLPLDTPQEFYVALGQFERMLDDPAVRFDYLLEEGDAVLFDNRRVMHARTAFSERDGEADGEETNRWLKGCYLEADSVQDRGRALHDKLHHAGQ